jgi:hypothetical protein
MLMIVIIVFTIQCNPPKLLVFTPVRARPLAAQELAVVALVREQLLEHSPAVP